MTADPVAFYVEVLRCRLRFLDGEIAKVGRWDDSFARLSEERDAVAHELAVLSDDRGAAGRPPNKTEMAGEH